MARDGGILPDGTFVQLPCIDTELLQEFFAEKVFAFLLDVQLIDEQVVDSMKSWEHSGFKFYAGEQIDANDGDTRQFLARYLKKAPLDLEPLIIHESGSEPIARYTKPLDDPEQDEITRSFSPARISCRALLPHPARFRANHQIFRSI